jgi:hypothetical protein
MELAIIIGKIKYPCNTDFYTCSLREKRDLMPTSR